MFHPGYHRLVSSQGKKVLLAMSGGVDSSVAAALLQRDGYEVVGCFMRLGTPDDETEGFVADGEGCGAGACRADDGPQRRQKHRGCCSVGDAADARFVAARLGISFYVCNFRRDFGRIIDYFVGEYNAGRTPNPCVRCNDWLKFGKLHEYARSIDAAFVASGHYAQVDHSDPDEPALLRGTDQSKDQSYALFGVPRQRLREMLLPIGGMQKSHVRQLAEELDLPVFNKPDSQEICFVPDDDYAGLVRRRTPEAVAPGVIRDVDGQTLGEHPGHQHFTVGQRRKIGVALGYPLFVVEKDPVRNEIVVGPREALMSIGCTAAESNWLVDADTAWRSCIAKVRYNSDPVPAEVRAVEGDRLEVRFADPVEAIGPGQAVVCYEQDRVICGGWIDAAVRSVSA